MFLKVREINGKGGSLTVGPHKAADIRTWTLTPLERGFAFSADLAGVDPFWVTRTPRTLRLPFGKQGLTWREVDLAIAGSHVTGTLPLLEEQ